MSNHISNHVQKISKDLPSIYWKQYTTHIFHNWDPDGIPLHQATWDDNRRRDRSSETEVSGLEARSRRKSWRWRMVAPWNQGVIRWMVAKSESPVDRWFISWCLGFQPSKVMQDSFHQQYDWNDIYCWIWWNDAGLIQWILITMIYP